MAFNFGIYHWRRWARSAGAGIALVVASLLARRSARSRTARAVLGIAGLGGATYTASVLLKVARLPPWRLEREKYDRLAARLPFEDADRVLDVGCGTGRSLVGLAPYVSEPCTVIGLDVFTDEIILGNTPSRAAENARRAGLDAAIVGGDATRLPFADRSLDIVTLSRVLHDLPKDDARLALEEIRRTMTAEGRIGVIELPVVHDDGADPERYWRELVTDAGFTVESVERTRWKGDRAYVVLTASP